jgi:hypothetical protein
LTRGQGMKQLHIVSILYVQCIIFSLQAEITPHIITFFIRPLPATQKEPTIERAEKTLSSPGNIVKTLIKKEINALQLYSGIYAAYAGHSAVSDANGQITFPRKTPGNTLHFIVTEDIKAVPVNPLNNKTILGFVPNVKAPLQHFIYERRQDPETELYSWNVSEAPLDTKKRIPADAIVLFANPKHIIAPIGSSHTLDSEHLMLPDIFVTPNFNSALNALRFFKIRHYFAPVKAEYKFIPDGYQQRITS